MAVINFNLKSEYVNAVCDQFKYDPALEPLETKQQFVERQAKQWLKQVAKAQLAQAAAEAAREQALIDFGLIGD